MDDILPTLQAEQGMAPGHMRILEHQIILQHPSNADLRCAQGEVALTGDHQERFFRRLSGLPYSLRRDLFFHFEGIPTVPRDDFGLPTRQGRIGGQRHVHSSRKLKTSPDEHAFQTLRQRGVDVRERALQTCGGLGMDAQGELVRREARSRLIDPGKPGKLTDQQFGQNSFVHAALPQEGRDGFCRPFLDLPPEVGFIDIHRCKDYTLPNTGYKSPCHILKLAMVNYGFEEVEHTADWALRVWGVDPASLFRAAAEGMLHLIGAQAVEGQRSWRQVHLSAADAEGLLVSWLEELLFNLETEGVTPTDFQLSITDRRELQGRVLEAPSERPKKEIKAVTFHNLSIEDSEKGLETVIVFDV